MKNRKICIAHCVKNETLHNMMLRFSSESMIFKQKLLMSIYMKILKKKTLVLHQGYKQHKICQLKIN